MRATCSRVRRPSQRVYYNEERPLFSICAALVLLPCFFNDVLQCFKANIRTVSRQFCLSVSTERTAAVDKSNSVLVLQQIPLCNRGDAEIKRLSWVAPKTLVLFNNLLVCCLQFSSVCVCIPHRATKPCALKQGSPISCVRFLNYR